MANKKQILLSAAMAGLMMAGNPVMADHHKSSDKVMCYGVNSCKGHGDCAGKVDACDGADGCSAKSTCKGHNSCKGKGFKKLSKKECKAKGGKFES